VSEIIEDTSLPAPEPVVNPDTASFWGAAAKGRLNIGRCRSCGEAIWYPRPMCPHCHSTDTLLEEVSGQGRVYSFTIVRRAIGEYAASLPYVLAYVELDEGPRVMTNLVGREPETWEIGQPVEVVFHRTPAGNAIPKFRPR
jgi:uncharacterized OB-fold protein